jgi:threonine synthase
MDKYYYKCFDCGKEYNKYDVEESLIYLCPDCGLVQKNQPLRGVLLIQYDYKLIRKNHSAAELKELEPGKFWQYGYLWPLEYEKGKVKGINAKSLDLIALGVDCVQELSSNDERFFILDDTRNPTLSFKDRASSLVVLKAMQMGIKEIAAASTGNAGSSLAGICARMGLKSIVFVPRNIPDSKRIQIQSFGAQVIVVDGNYDLAFDTCLELSQKKHWYNRNTAYNPLTIEGKKSSAYDIFISFHGKIPDIIFVPVGDGVIIAGLYKGFWELKQLGWIKKIPQLIAVQAEGSNAVVKYMTNKKFRYFSTNSIADSICAGAPRNLFMAYDSIAKSGGSAVAVSDKEILTAQKTVAQKYGILIEPSSAASYAGYKKYCKTKSIGKKTPLLLFTGNGLKDISALMKWNDASKPVGAEAIRKIFHAK